MFTHNKISEAVNHFSVSRVICSVYIMYYIVYIMYCSVYIMYCIVYIMHCSVYFTVRIMYFEVDITYRKNVTRPFEDATSIVSTSNLT